MTENSEYGLGYLKGRQEMLEEFRRECSRGEDWQVSDPRFTYVDVQIDKETYRMLFPEEHA